MTTATKATTKTRTGKTAPRKRAAPKAKNDSVLLHSPQLFQELIERARLAQEQGRKQLETLRERLEPNELTQALRDRFEQGSELLQHERERVEHWVGDAGSWFDTRRELLLHWLGIASSRDLDKMARQLKALRGRLHNLQQVAEEHDDSVARQA